MRCILRRFNGGPWHNRIVPVREGQGGMFVPYFGDAYTEDRIGAIVDIRSQRVPYVLDGGEYCYLEDNGATSNALREFMNSRLLESIIHCYGVSRNRSVLLSLHDSFREASQELDNTIVRYARGSPSPRISTAVQKMLRGSFSSRLNVVEVVLDTKRCTFTAEVVS